MTGVQTCALPICHCRARERGRNRDWRECRHSLRAKPVRRAWHPRICWQAAWPARDRKSTRLNSSHLVISYAVFCLKKKQRKIGFRAEIADLLRSLAIIEDEIGRAQ